MEIGKRYAVFSVKKAEHNGGAVWVRAGYAWANRDGSANVQLDVLPLDGKLHIREAGEQRTDAGSARAAAAPPQSKQQKQVEAQLVDSSQSMGGH